MEDTNKIAWQIRIDVPADGVPNMAIDSEMLAKAERGESSFRLYTWAGPTVTLGRFQDKRDDDGNLKPDGIDIEACQRFGIGIVVRPTGGKAVLHGHDLGITYACPLSLLQLDKTSVKAVYRKLTKLLIQGLNSADVPAELGENILPSAAVKAMASADCFFSISPNDIINTSTMKKMVGCALRVTRKAALMQCSLPIRLPLVPPQTIFDKPSLIEPLNCDLATVAWRIAQQCCDKPELTRIRVQTQLACRY